jgi:hypothetical protein
MNNIIKRKIISSLIKILIINLVKIIKYNKIHYNNKMIQTIQIMNLTEKQL